MSNKVLAPLGCIGAYRAVNQILDFGVCLRMSVCLLQALNGSSGKCTIQLSEEQDNIKFLFSPDFVMSALCEI